MIVGSESCCGYHESEAKPEVPGRVPVAGKIEGKVVIVGSESCCGYPSNSDDRYDTLVNVERVDGKFGECFKIDEMDTRKGLRTIYVNKFGRTLDDVRGPLCEDTELYFGRTE